MLRASAPLKDTVAKAWLRALELTAPIARNPGRLLSTVVDQQASRLETAPALVSDRQSFTYRELAARMNQYARWALHQNLQKGDVVCLLVTNQPEYLAMWLGVTSVGCVVALLNTNLIGSSLAHSINAVAPRHLIVSSDRVETLLTALPELAAKPVIWSLNDTSAALPSLFEAVEQFAGESLTERERRSVSIEDRALCIYTSGTTGLPKAANVSHARIMQWSHWFAGMMHAQVEDRLYDCLPLYHSVGGVQAPGAMLVAGGSVVITEKFSAGHFWEDIVRWDCSVFQYIGELCRYLLHTSPSLYEGEHRLRMACGNGLAPDVWENFQTRFRIPQILEFYASTEGGVSLFNVEGKPGSIGRVPSYLAHRYAPALARFDVQEGELVRDEHGACLRSGMNEVGELLARIEVDPANPGSRYEGYVDKESTEKKILRGVFQPDDCWLRTGDLMRKDDQGFFYFVDRVGDTFRWKGENVATSEVAQVLTAFPGIEQATVYGVAVPGSDGKVGMAAVVTHGKLDLAALRTHLREGLPAYACPAFLRVRSSIEVTGTFKYAKAALVRQGYDPAASADLIYVDHKEYQAFTLLDDTLHRLVEAGLLRL